MLVQGVKDLSKPDLVIGQGFVEELLSGPVHRNGVVFALADVQAYKDINAFVVSDHLYLPVVAADTCAGLSAVSEPGIHVTHDDPKLSCLY